MIELKVNGQTFSGWERASVRRGINILASSASLTVSQKYANGSINIPLDAPC